MVTREEKLRMTQFIADRLEDSCHYEILQRTPAFVKVKNRSILNGSITYVIAHTNPMTLDKLERVDTLTRREGALITHVFYKDGENFFVRLAERGHIKGNDRSLKNYSSEEINSIVHLRGLEKRILANPPKKVLKLNGLPEFEMPVLAYFQPGTERLEESLKLYWMKRVVLDYSHVSPDHRSYGFVENKESIDYRLPIEVSAVRIDEAAGLKRGRANSSERIFIGPFQPQNIEAEFKRLKDDYEAHRSLETRQRARDYFAGLNEQQQKYIRNLFGLNRRG